MLHNVIHLPSDDCKSAWFLVFCFSLEKRTIHDFTPETRWHGRRVAPCASRLKYTNVQKKKHLYINPLLHPRDSPWAETSVKDVDQILTWQFRNKKIQATKMFIGLPVFIQWGQVPKFTSKRQWCHFTNYGPAHLSSSTLSPSCVWKTCMTEDSQLNSGVNY